MGIFSSLITSHPYISAIIGGLLVLSVLGFIIYKIVTRKKFNFDEISNNNSTEDINTKNSSYGKINESR